MESRLFTDQMKQPVNVSFPPKKIISLVPSQTELLAELNLSKEVVGITKFCVHPASWQREKIIVGGTKNFDIQIIEKIEPHLIIGNKEENDKTQIELLQKRYPVYMTDICCYADALAMIKVIGEVTDRIEQAEKIIKSIDKEFTFSPLFHSSVLYLIWRKPWMAAGTNTFIDSMLDKIGLKNVITESRYPVLTLQVFNSLTPQYVFLSSEPYPFQAKHIDEVKRLFPSSQIVLVDGEMFSWYGPRMLKAPAYFRTLPIS